MFRQSRHNVNVPFQTDRKGILLAGGSGTRLYPATRMLCKQLLPLYDKPMIYYPLSTLMLTGIREVQIISTPRDLPRFKELFGDGGELGMEISYAAQDEPRGIADSLRIGAKFVGRSPITLVLGDNVFFGHGFPQLLQEADRTREGATVFGYRVAHPERYGVVTFDRNGTALQLEEKPEHPGSDYAVVGLYFYDSSAVEIAAELEPSERGELEITDLNRVYLERGNLNVQIMGRGYAWLDTGTHEDMLEAASFIRTIEDRQGVKIACIEEIAWRNGWIDDARMHELAQSQLNSGYGDYLLDLLEDEDV